MIDVLKSLLIYVTPHVTFGPNAQMTSLSNSLSNDTKFLISLKLPFGPKMSQTQTHMPDFLYFCYYMIDVV